MRYYVDIVIPNVYVRPVNGELRSQLYRNGSNLGTVASPTRTQKCLKRC